MGRAQAQSRRSETHQSHATEVMGFAKTLYPSYDLSVFTLA